jgi:pantothenate kinase
VSKPTDAIARLLDERPGRVVVGLTGPPGVGKSTLAQRIVDEFNGGRMDVAALLPMDGFHLSNAQLARLGRRGRVSLLDLRGNSSFETAQLGKIAISMRSHVPGVNAAGLGPGRVGVE